MAAAVKKSVEITLNHTKTTKNTERYDASNDEAAVTNIYIKKGLLGEPRPDSVKVTVVPA